VSFRIVFVFRGVKRYFSFIAEFNMLVFQFSVEQLVCYIIFKLEERKHGRTLSLDKT